MMLKKMAARLLYGVVTPIIEVNGKAGAEMNSINVEMSDEARAKIRKIKEMYKQLQRLDEIEDDAMLSQYAFAWAFNGFDLMTLPTDVRLKVLALILKSQGNEDE